MPVFQLHVDDVGIPFEVNPLDDDGVDSLDLSTATLLEFWFQKPDGSMLIVEATWVINGDGGLVRYEFADGDLDQPGSWRCQIRTEIAGDAFRSPVFKFKVKPNLPLET